MNDLIDRQAAINAVQESRRLNYHQDGKEACAHEYEHRHFLKILLELPSAQLEEPKTGYWITLKDEYEDIHEAICSCCNSNGNHKWNYCPNCGARMEG